MPPIADGAWRALQSLADSRRSAKVANRLRDRVSVSHGETLQPVTWKRKPFVTRCRARLATVCGMDESWRQLADEKEPQPRIRWARLHCTNFERPTDAAKSLNIRPGTYRTYEHLKADGGRRPELTELQRIAKKFDVSWTWLLTGDGRPDDKSISPLVAKIAAKLDAIPEEKREDAEAAIDGLLDAYARKAG
jgi:transcriptional regulator with XRE-family HTH domain